MIWSGLAGVAAALAIVQVSIVSALAQEDEWLRSRSPGSRSAPPPKTTPRAQESQPAAAATTSQPPHQLLQHVKLGRVSREVLAIYDGTQEPGPDRTRIHRYLELPLNHLGQKVTYWDLRNGLPDAGTMQRHRAVVTWFGERIADPEAFLEWAARQASQGVRFAVIEFVGSALGPNELPRVNAFLRHLGVEIVPRWVGPSEAGSILERDGAMVDFEHRLAGPLPGYMVVESKGAGVKSHLTLLSKDMKVAPQARSAVVTTSAGGGLAYVGYVRHYDPKTYRLSWIINPFAFLQAALGLELGPIPDTTTIAGRRIYFSHIDGDGWNNSGKVDGKWQIGAPVVLRELLMPYPDLPVSVGLIAGDVDPKLGGLASGAQAAREIFALRQVEVASHTHTHPFFWSFFEPYDREHELAKVALNRARLLRLEDRSLGALAKLGTQNYRTLVERAFTAGGSHMPRARMARAFDVDLEVKGALDASRALAPDGKPVALYLWSGDTRPFESAVRVARLAGVRNLNGGDARLDRDFPSVMYVPPIARPVGAERQIYAVNSNENTYTNGWTGPFDGQAKLTETWKNTDAPRRLKGMNLYYHMYSGTRDESLAALKRILDGVREAPVHPVAASRYAEIADDFFDVEIQRTAALRWRVSRRGALQTMRYDSGAGLYVDMRQSQGVLGFTHHAGSLYVALDEAVPDATVALTTSKPEPRQQERPVLVESRWSISRLKVAPCGFEAEARGYGPGQMTWAGLKAGRYTVAALPEGSAAEVASEASVGSDGELRIELKADAIGGARIRVACSGGTTAVETGTVPR